MIFHFGWLSQLVTDAICDYDENQRGKYQERTRRQEKRVSFENRNKSVNALVLESNVKILCGSCSVV